MLPIIESVDKFKQSLSRVAKKRFSADNQSTNVLLKIVIDFVDTSRKMSKAGPLSGNYGHPTNQTYAGRLRTVADSFWNYILSVVIIINLNDFVYILDHNLKSNVVIFSEQ